MARSKLYTVQPVLPDSDTQAASSTSVFANGPLQAARMVLGASITTRGPKDALCGRVWELREDLTPSSTEFFRVANKEPSPSPDARTSGEWLVLLKVLAICAVVMAIGSVIVMRYGA